MAVFPETVQPVSAAEESAPSLWIPPPYVSVEFPGGYTSLCATGYWKQSDATMREDTRILLILAPSHAKEKIRRIARQYKRIFHQEAVLITTSPADAEFVDATFEDEQLKAPEDGIFVPAGAESEKTGE